MVAIQGTEGLSEKDTETLESMGTQRVTLLMDADAAGRAAEERLKDKLANFAVDKITLPEGEDPNSFLIKNGAAALSALLAPTPTPISLRSTPTSTSPVNTTSSPSGSPTLVLGLRRYEVRGLEKTARALKATIRVERAGKLHVDTLDLYSARARRQLVLDLVRILEETPDTIESDVLKLLTACESHPDTGLRGGAAAGQPRVRGRAPALSAQDRSEGEALGRDPKLIETILADYERCGLVGERAEQLLCYLAMTSRKMPRPLAVLNLASSGAGKTALRMQRWRFARRRTQ